MRTASDQAGDGSGVGRRPRTAALPLPLLLLFHLLGVVAGPRTAAAAAACDPSAARQAHDWPIVLKGPVPLRGQQVGAINAYASHGGVWQAVPVQVEEVNSRGDYVLAEGLPFTKATDDGIFDDNDEVVLDSRDLGDDFAPAAVPAELLAGARGAWKSLYCRAGAFVGALLVTSGPAAPAFKPPVRENSVRFSDRDGEVQSPLYRYTFSPGHPAMLGNVHLRTKGGKEVPVLRDARFQMPLVLPFFLPDMRFGGEDFTSSIESWQAGPHRTIVAVGVKYTSFLSLFKLHLFSELVFYRNRFVIPTVIEFVFDPSKVLRAGSGVAYALSFPEDRAWTVESNLPRLPAAAPATALVAARRSEAATADRFVARGSRAGEGAFRVEVRVDPRAREMVAAPFLFDAGSVADPALQRHWPWLGSMGGDLGLFLDFSEVRQGTYDFGLDLLVSDKADERFTDFIVVNVDWHTMPIRP